MALTSDQLSDFRADIADEGTPPAFSDTELERLFERADSDYDRAVYLAFRQLRNNAVKLTNYTAGMTTEQRRQVFENLQAVVSDYEREASGNQQARIVGVRRVPPPIKDRPAGEPHPDEKARRHDDARLRPWRGGW